MSKRVPYEPPWYAKACPWDDIEQHYIKWFEGLHVEMVTLIRHIKNSGLASRLYAYTSMDKLVVSVNDKLDPHKESLHVTYDLGTSKWIFEYYGGPLYGQHKTTPEFYRVYDKDLGIDKFDKFIERIGW